MSDHSSLKVAVRLRPLVKQEIEKGCKNILEVHKDLSQIRIKDTDKAFTFNYVLDTDSNQADLYNSCIRDTIPTLFQGFNLTILAYGQTGSGKTFSMGTTYSGNEEMGVIPRSVKQIFEFVKDNFVFDFTITVSFIELYQEVLYDLLSGKPRDQCTLEIREDPHRGIYIPGITEITVENAQDILNCLIKGSSGRATASTFMNAQSSRSHAIFTVNISMQSRNNSEENKTAKFHLVDLAGSERPKKTGAVGTTFKEGVNINKGLLGLGNVISVLGDEKQQDKFVPYRDSNLTRLLKDSLGGNSITLMIACVSPADYNIDETISTLRYADRAKKIKNKPIINQDPKAAQIYELKKTIKLLQLQIIEQDGPSVSSKEVVLTKENSDLTTKIGDLTHKLSSALNDKADLLAKLLFVQSINETLAKKIFDFKESYSVIFNEVTCAIESGSIVNLESLKIKLEEMKVQFEYLEAETKKTEEEIKLQEADTSNLMEHSNCNEAQAKEIVDVQETYAARQIELNLELKDVMKKLVMKEVLAEEMKKNVVHMVDYDKIRQNEVRIDALEKEKAELLQQLKNAQHSFPNKVSEDRRKRVKELESQIQDYKKKLNEQNRLIRFKEKDELKIQQLNREILLMKQNRIKLVKNMKEDSERFRKWKLQRDRELAKVKQEGVKNKNQMQKMEASHLKQQNVLKRRVEEAAAVNKRLKDLMATKQVVQGQKFSGRLEKVTNWLKQEIEVILGVTETEVTLGMLLEDRAMLQKQLDALKSDSNPVLSHIKAIEDDIELRSVQIQDIQQKLLDADEDEKSKSIRIDNVQSMAEAKQAIKVLVDEMVEMKKKECCLKIKSIDLENVPTEEHDRSVYKDKIKLLEQKHSDSLNNMEQEYQEKISILLGQLRGVEMRTTTTENENLNTIIQMQQNKLDEMEKRLEEEREIRIKEKEQEKRNKEEEQAKQNKEEEQGKPNKGEANICSTEVTPPKRLKLCPLVADDTFTLQESTENVQVQDVESFAVPKDVTPLKRFKLFSRFANETFTFRDSEKENFRTPEKNADGSFFEDDLTKDPDWRITPIGRRIASDKKDVSVLQAGLTAEEKEKKAPKRSSGGGCACTTNCSGRCGCRKTGKECLSNCRCNKLSCTNRTVLTEGSKSMEEVSETKKPRKKFFAFRRYKPSNYLNREVP